MGASGATAGWWRRCVSRSRDADGDGLLPPALQQADPNGAAAGADGDGLTDRFEWATARPA